MFCLLCGALCSYPLAAVVCSCLNQRHHLFWRLVPQRAQGDVSQYRAGSLRPTRAGSFVHMYPCRHRKSQAKARCDELGHEGFPHLARCGSCARPSGFPRAPGQCHVDGVALSEARTGHTTLVAQGQRPIHKHRYLDMAPFEPCCPPPKILLRPPQRCWPGLHRKRRPQPSLRRRVVRLPSPYVTSRRWARAENCPPRRTHLRTCGQAPTCGRLVRLGPPPSSPPLSPQRRLCRWCEPPRKVASVPLSWSACGWRPRQWRHGPPPLLPLQQM